MSLPPTSSGLVPVPQPQSQPSIASAIQAAQWAVQQAAASVKTVPSPKSKLPPGHPSGLRASNRPITGGARRLVSSLARTGHSLSPYSRAKKPTSPLTSSVTAKGQNQLKDELLAAQQQVQTLTQQLKTKDNELRDISSELEAVRDKSNGYIRILLRRLKQYEPNISKAEIDLELPQELAKQAQEKRALLQRQAVQLPHMQPAAVVTSPIVFAQPDPPPLQSIYGSTPPTQSYLTVQSSQPAGMTYSSMPSTSTSTLSHPARPQGYPLMGYLDPSDQ